MSTNLLQAYMLAREDRNLRAIAERVHTIYFLATPHRGADLAKTLGNILRVSGISKTFVTELDRSSDSIASINDSFRHFAEDLHLWSFYETVDSDFGVTKVRIVDKNSATLGFAHEMNSPLDADHRGVCKFSQEADSNYLTLLKAFTTTIDLISAERNIISPFALLLTYTFQEPNQRQRMPLNNGLSLLRCSD
jgi:hypothetical protein